MGHTELEPETEKPQEVEASYRITVYPAHLLPLDFKNVIMAPFLNSLKDGNDWFKLIDRDAYYTAYPKFIELLLNRPLATIRLAKLKDETVLGWSLSDKDILHYVWVKKEVRRQGIARALVPKDIQFISHITNKGLNIWVNKAPHWRFNPFV